MALQWGIMGTGTIAKVFAQAIRESDAGVPYAVASRRTANAESFAKENGIEKAYDSYEEMLTDRNIDIVYVATPHTCHRDNVIAIAEAKKHILCEKPMGVSAAECREMVEAAHARGSQLFEAFMYRTHPQTLRLQQLLEEKAVGDILSIRTSFCFGLGKGYNVRLDKSLRGGGLYDVGCYCIDFSRMVAGEEPDVYQAAYTLGLVSGVDENLAGTLEFQNGAIAQFHVSISSMGDASAFILGTEGSIALANPWKPGAGQNTIVLDRKGKGREEIHVEGKASSYVYQAEHVAAVLEGKAENLIPGDRAIGNALIMDQMWNVMQGENE